MLINLKNIDITVAGNTLLENIDFHVDTGEFVYLIGRVGSGKSSLLKTIYRELPVGENGEAEVLGHDLHKISRKDTQALRRELGIVFQDFQLLHDRSVEGNLDFVLKATGWKKKLKRKERINEVLEQVDLISKIDAFPHQLSGGEQQRVAIARALLNNPRVILADEPTGNLDKETSENIVSLLRSICEKGTAVVMITHNIELLRLFPGIVYKCVDGRLEEEMNGMEMPSSECERLEGGEAKDVTGDSDKVDDGIKEKYKIMGTATEESCDNEDMAPITPLN